MMKKHFFEIVEINPKVEIKKGEICPCVMMEDITPGRKYVQAQSEREYKGGSKFKDKDTLFARITPCLENGKIAQYRSNNGQNAFGSTEYFIFRAIEGISDPDYIYYLCSTRTIREPAEKSMQGVSGRQRADVASVEKLPLDVPDLPTQRRIASILSAYDDLIENNTRRIKILEEMARLIYREWFVEFHAPGVRLRKATPEEKKVTGKDVFPEGWEVSRLFDIAEITYGFPFKANLFSNEAVGIPVVRIRNINNNFSTTYTTEEADERYLLENGDLIVGMDGDFHMGKWSGGEAYLNQRVVRFRPKNGFSRYFLFHSLEAPIQHFDSTITGTTVAHLSDRDLRSICIVIPTVQIRKESYNIMESIFVEEITLRVKNHNLRRTRDLLLPKLISGEINVNS